MRGLAGRDEAVAGRVDILDIARVASKKTGVPVEVLLQA